MKTLFSLVFVSALFADLGYSNPVDVLANRLLKTYDSSAQSLYEPDYFDVTLKHCEVDVTNVPDSESNSRFFLLEQAISTYIDRPYRVRLVKIKYDALSDTYLSMNFEPENPGKYAGVCRSGKKMTLAYSNFESPKCIVSMKKVGNDFIGGTPDGGCISTHNGASSFTSEVKITENSINSWDRGFDASGNQVWGARKGPYKFKEINELDQSPILVEFASYLLGHASNIEQHNKDPKSFALIDYSICPMRLEGANGNKTRTFFVEQKIKLPHKDLLRYRIYSLTKEPGVDISFYAYVFVNEEIESELAGFCETDKPVNYEIPRSYVEWNEPCQMNFQPSDFFNGQNGIVGMTQIGGCPSEFNGSKYLTISAKMTNDAYIIWERWWDEENKQVAGATKDGYIYKRDRGYTYRSYK